MTSPPRPEVCVGAVVVHDGALLLIERGRGMAVGSWSIPGGRVESGESVTEAVVREVAEETGLAVTCGPFLGWAERRDDEHHVVILDFLATVADPAIARAGDDAAAVAWVPLGEVAAYPGLVPGLATFLADHGVIG